MVSEHGLFAGDAASIALAPVDDLHRSIDLESFWSASLNLVGAALPHHSCSLMFGIDDYEPRAARHHVAQAQHHDYMPATSLQVSRPYLRAHPQVRLYTYSEIVSQDPGARRRRLALEEPVEEWADFVHLAFWHDARPAAVLSIRRSERQPRFTGEELTFLEKVYPVIDAAVYRLRALEEERTRSAVFERLLRATSAPALLVDAQGRLLFATEAAHRMCALWNSAAAADPALPRIPDDLPDLLARPGVDEGLKLAHSSLPMGLRLELCRPQGSLFSSGAYGMLTFADADGGARSERPLDPSVLDRLSPSERRVALLVASGLRNGQIAERLSRSRRTVESQLNSIYGKLDIDCRTQLVNLLR